MALLLTAKAGISGAGYFTLRPVDRESYHVVPEEGLS